MKHIRIATKEEVEAIREIANFQPRYSVFAMDNIEGSPDIAVVKETIELDPVIFSPKSTTRQRARFIWALEERMAGAGIKQYRFAVRDSDEEWKQTLKHWGCRQLNDFSEARFEKEL